MNTEPTKSYLSILSNAKNLFWKHGIRRVTVEEICKEAGVSKMTFYRSFENKDDVAHKVLKDVTNKAVNSYRTIMADTQDSYPEKIGKVILLEHENAADISQEFIQDIYQRNESDLKSYLEAYQKDFQKEMINDFRQAQKEGWIRKEVKMDFIPHMLEMLNQKMTDEAFLSLYGSSHDAIMELTNFFFYGILTHQNTSDE